jgi:hypothetical protein
MTKTSPQAEPLQFIIDFVEGRVGTKAFADRLYEDKALEELLSDDSLEWGSTCIVTNPYYYCIEQDFGSASGSLNAQGALELFLERKGVAFAPSKDAGKKLDLLRRVQPSWLDVDTRWLEHTVVSEAGDRSGKELERWLRTRLKELFRCHKRPPRWLQSPAWPIGDNGPLYFLGQIALDRCEHFHDVAAVYVFLDPVSGTTETIIQVC